MELNKLGKAFKRIRSLINLLCSNLEVGLSPSLFSLFDPMTKGVNLTLASVETVIINRYYTQLCFLVYFKVPYDFIMRTKRSSCFLLFMILRQAELLL